MILILKILLILVLVAYVIDTFTFVYGRHPAFKEGVILQNVLALILRVIIISFGAGVSIQVWS